MGAVSKTLFVGRVEKDYYSAEVLGELAEQPTGRTYVVEPQLPAGQQRTWTDKPAGQHHAARRTASIGAEVIPVGQSKAVLLATNRAACGRLCRQLTHGRRKAPKGECHLTFNDVSEWPEEPIACVVLDSSRAQTHQTEHLSRS